MFEKVNTWRACLVASVSVLGVAAGSPSFAQDAETEASGKADIIVTANLRRERMQDVPIAITAITSESLESSGVTTTVDLPQVVSGLVYQNGLSGLQAHLRGAGTTAVAAGNENSIATYIDGVYVLSMLGSMMELSNIEQVEVLKGPQGTLFGRNATGGVISIKTRDPQHTPAMDLSLGYGNFDTIKASGYVTGGLTSDLAVDLAGVVAHQGDGWGKNLFTGEDINKTDSYAVRTKWLFTPSDRDEIRLTADYSYLDGSPAPYRLIDGTAHNYGPGTTTVGERPDLAQFIGPNLAPFAVVGDPYVCDICGPYDTNTAYQPYSENEGWGVSLQWDHEFDTVRIQSLTAYREFDSFQFSPSGPTPAPRVEFGYDQKDDQFSQEFQLASISGNIDWLVGLYYLKGHSDYDPFYIAGTPFNPLSRLTFNAATSVESGAVFGQATVPLGSRTNITVGGRYTVEKRTLAGDIVLHFLPGILGPDPVSFVDPESVVDSSETFKKFTWRLSLDHNFTPDILGYVSWNRGFKSGIYNTVPAVPIPVEPEVLDAYEVGLKSEFADGAVRLNLAGFYYDYQDLQVTVFTTTSALIDNGAKAEVYGIDVDLQIQPSRQLTITGALTWMHSEFKEYPAAQFFVPQAPADGGGTILTPSSAAGNKLPYSPDLTANVSVNYEVLLPSGKIDLNANLSYNDGWYPDPGNILKQESYVLAAARVNWHVGDSGLQIGVWGKNLFDKKYYQLLTSGGNPGGYEEGVRGAPRTYGITLGFEY